MDKIILQSIISNTTLHKYISHNSAVVWIHFQPITVTAVKLVKSYSIQECPIDGYCFMICRRFGNFRGFYQTCHTAQKHKEICQPHLDSSVFHNYYVAFSLLFILRTEALNTIVTSMIWFTKRNHEKNSSKFVDIQATKCVTSSIWRYFPNFF